jgi:hypothetical protein
MGVRNDGPGYGIPGVDEEFPGGTVKAVRRWQNDVRHDFSCGTVNIRAKVPELTYGDTCLYGKVLLYRAGYMR